MINVGQKVAYKGFGLNILSEVLLPELRILNKIDNLIDVSIEIKDLSSKWNEIVPENQTYLVKENTIIFKILDTAIFCITNGNKIEISPLNGLQEDKIRLFLLGTCMGALLIQRKIIPLHGSAIEVNGNAYAIVGESGAGKSTLASAFIKKGYKLLSDDVIAVSFSDEQIPFVTPSYPQQKLWQESLKEFGMEKNSYRPIIEREEKYAIPVTASFSEEAIPLAGVFELVKTENEHIRIQKIEGVERIQLLFKHTYRNFLIELLNLMGWHFYSSMELVKKIDLFQLSRPASEFTAYQLVSIILNTIEKENIKND